MIRLPKSCEAWDTPHFDSVLKQELEALPVDQLPLQHCLRVGNFVLDEKRNVLIQSVVATGDVVRVKFGLFFNSIIGGCSCADDPTPVEAENEYCELWLSLDRQTGQGDVSLIDEHE